MSVASNWDALVGRIRPRLGDGSSVLIGAHVLQTALRLGSSLILTRLLAPEAYGIVGILNSLSYILTMVSDMGLRGYITRHEHARPDLLKTVWTVRLIRNATIAVVMFLGADVFAALYNAPEVALAFRICSLTFLIEASQSLAFYMNERWRGAIKLTLIEFARFLIVTTVTIVAAYYLRNYWAVVIAMLLQPALTSLASHFVLKSPPVGFALSREHFMDLWRFWRLIIPASILTIALTQTNVFVIAHYFPLAELGRYALAASLAAAANLLTSQYVMRIFFPAFAEAFRNTPDRIREVYYDSKRRIVLVFAFGLGGLIGGAELLVRVLFNDNYAGAGLYISLLLLRPLGSLVNEPAQQALITVGHIRVALITNIARIVWVATAGPIALYLAGPIALIAVMCLAELAVAPYLLWRLSRNGLLRVREELTLAGVALGAAAIGFGIRRGAEALMAQGVLPNF